MAVLDFTAFARRHGNRLAGSPRTVGGYFGFATVLCGLAWIACGDGTTGPPEEDRNRAPISVGTIPPQALRAGDSATVDVSHYFSDPDDDPLSYTATSSNPNVATAQVSGTMMAITGVAPGTATVTATARDPSGLTATQAVPVTVDEPLPGIAFSMAQVAAPEGDTVVLEVIVRPPPRHRLTLPYTAGPDTDETTSDADSLDYVIDGHGTVEIPSGESRGEITIAITDDDDIESVRESFRISLLPSDTASSYILRTPSSADVIINEGVCDRTSQVRNEIMYRAEVNSCAAVDKARLDALDRLFLCRFPSSSCPNPQDPIATLHSNDFRQLPNLQYLRITHNDLRALPIGVFSSLSRLRQLVLNEDLRTVTGQEFSSLSSLRSLYLYNLNLTQLPPQWFRGLSPHSDDSDHRFRQNDHRFRRIPITLEESGGP